MTVQENIVQVTKFIPADRPHVFSAWVNPAQLENWCYPDGFKLSVLEFEAREGGKYWYAYSGPDGLYNCTGTFQEFVRNEKLVSLDRVLSPEGKLIFDGLQTIVTFRDKAGGTEISVTQGGFKNAQNATNCKKSWLESLEKLDQYMDNLKGIQLEGDLNA